MNTLTDDGLNEAARRFDRWRRSLRGPGRIPNELWYLAAEVALVHGVEETARRLRVDEGRLRQRMQGVGRTNAAAKASFVELPPLPLGPASECIFEVESSSGRKVRISLTGAATAHTLELGRLLCGDGA